mgnify:CR=1 FL=1
MRTRLEARVTGDVFDGVASDRLVEVTARDTGQRAAVETQYLGHGRLFLVEGDERRLAWVAEDDERRWVFVDGELVVVDLARGGTPRRVAAAPGGHDILAAPMPATVVRVVAPPGTRVARGATVLLLEAMKMELPLRAPHDAVVAAIHCREGELVQPHVPLVDLDATR